MASFSIQSSSNEGGELLLIKDVGITTNCPKIFKVLCFSSPALSKPLRHSVEEGETAETALARFGLVQNKKPSPETVQKHGGHRALSPRQCGSHGGVCSFCRVPELSIPPARSSPWAERQGPGPSGTAPAEQGWTPKRRRSFSSPMPSAAPGAAAQTLLAPSLPHSQRGPQHKEWHLPRLTLSTPSAWGQANPPLQQGSVQTLQLS